MSEEQTVYCENCENNIPISQLMWDEESEQDLCFVCACSVEVPKKALIFERIGYFRTIGITLAIPSAAIFALALYIHPKGPGGYFAFGGLLIAFLTLPLISGRMDKHG